MTGVCERDNAKKVIWELQEREDGQAELFFTAEEGAGIPDYSYEISAQLPPWADYARSIVRIHLDSKIEVIGKQSFRGMDHLEEVRFLSENGEKSRLRLIGAHAFAECRSLREIRLPDSVEEIGNSAFANAERLSCAEIGNGLKRLGNMVFSYNVSLERLYIRSACLSEVGSRLFVLNHRLSVCECPTECAGAAELKRQYDMIYSVGGEELMQSTGRWAESLSAVPAHGRTTRPDDHGSLTETVRYRLLPIRKEEYCLEISGTGAMPDWDSRECQPWRAKAPGIRELRVMSGITSIGNLAFSGLTGLLKVCVSGTVKTVGVAAFGECAGLKELCFQEGLETLGCRSLWGCVGLETLRLPQSFRAADLFATAYCPALKDVRYAGSKSMWMNRVIVDNMMERNIALTDERLHFNPEESAAKVEGTERAALLSRNYRAQLRKIAGILEAHGDGSLHVIAVNLGKDFLLSKTGDSTLLIFPEGSTMLIDTGACGNRYHLTGFFRDIGLKHLDYLVFTHPHGDHFGGATELLRYLRDEKKGEVNEVWYSGAMMESEQVRTVIQLLQGMGATIRMITTGKDRMGEQTTHRMPGGVKLTVYGPDEQDVRVLDLDNSVENVNDSSLVLRFCFGETVFLTGGDIYGKKERYLLDTYGAECFRADVLKMNHHGNFQANTREWVNATRPTIAFAEADGNGNSEVIRRYTQSGAMCYSTGLDGMLHITMGKEKNTHIFHQYESLLRADLRL